MSRGTCSVSSDVTLPSIVEHDPDAAYNGTSNDGKDTRVARHPFKKPGYASRNATSELWRMKLTKAFLLRRLEMIARHAVLIVSLLRATCAFGDDGSLVVPTLEKQLLAEGSAVLAKAARQQGDATRGAVLFYQPHLTCTKCHTFGEESSPLGPDLTKPEKKATDVFLVESILEPSKEIREGYEPVVVITDEGLTVTGLLVEDHAKRLVLRDPNEDDKLITIPKDAIDDQAESTVSIMTPALVDQLANRQQFLDLVRYVMEITEGGPQRALELEPDPSLYAEAAVFFG